MQDQDLFIQSKLKEDGDKEFAGYVRGRKIYYWECPPVDTFALAVPHTNTSLNCTTRPKVEFMRQEHKYTGYLDLPTGRIRPTSGAQVECSERDNFMNIGFGMMVEFNESGEYLIAEGNHVARQNLEEFIPRNLPIDGIAEMMKSESLSYEVNQLAEIVYQNIDNGALVKDHGIEAELGQSMTRNKIEWPKIHHFGTKSLILTLVVLGVLVIIVITACCRCPCRGHYQKRQRYEMIEMRKRSGKPTAL